MREKERKREREKKERKKMEESDYLIYLPIHLNTYLTEDVMLEGDWYRETHHKARHVKERTE